MGLDSQLNHYKMVGWFLCILCVKPWSNELWYEVTEIITSPYADQVIFFYHFIPILFQYMSDELFPIIPKYASPSLWIPKLSTKDPMSVLYIYIDKIKSIYIPYIYTYRYRYAIYIYNVHIHKYIYTCLPAESQWSNPQDVSFHRIRPPSARASPSPTSPTPCRRPRWWRRPARPTPWKARGWNNGGVGKTGETHGKMGVSVDKNEHNMTKHMIVVGWYH